jgi:nitric oxide dioxygenase
MLGWASHQSSQLKPNTSQMAETSSIPDPAPLTEEQRKLIKDTVPVLAKYGGEITRRFYSTMLEANPSLKDLFSHSKQAVCNDMP